MISIRRKDQKIETKRCCCSDSTRLMLSIIITMITAAATSEIQKEEMEDVSSTADSSNKKRNISRKRLRCSDCGYCSCKCAPGSLNVQLIWEATKKIREAATAADATAKKADREATKKIREAATAADATAKKADREAKKKIREAATAAETEKKKADREAKKKIREAATAAETEKKKADREAKKKIRETATAAETEKKKIREAAIAAATAAATEKKKIREAMTIEKKKIREVATEKKAEMKKIREAAIAAATAAATEKKKIREAAIVAATAAATEKKAEAKKIQEAATEKIWEAALAAATAAAAEKKKIREAAIVAATAAATAAATQKKADREAKKKIREADREAKKKIREATTAEELDRAAVEAKAAPKNYIILKATLQTAELVYKKTGRYISKDLCISSPKQSININNDSFSKKNFSTKEKSAAPADLIATFPRYDGTVLVMPPKTRGSYKHYTEIGGYMQPYHGAGTGESPSNVLIGSIRALNCVVAHHALTDALKEENFTGGVLMRLFEDWKAGAPNASTLMDYYNSKLNYVAVGFFLGDKSEEGYINMGISANLRSQYDSDLKSIIGPDYQLNNRVSVYAPELVPLLKASHLGSGVRMHSYAAGTGEMRAHHDSYNNKYEDKLEQKYSILFAHV